MSNNLSENDIAELKEAFTMFGIDNNGYIKHVVMEIIMRNL